MKKSIIKLLLIYLILFSYLFISTSLYGIYIIKTNNNENIIINHIISIFFYILIGFLYSNHFHKKGLIIGILASIVHLFVFKLILLIFKQNPSFNLLSIVIYSISGGIGGFLGIVFKKLI
jgi:hypothetical protein